MEVTKPNQKPALNKVSQNVTNICTFYWYFFPSFLSAASNFSESWFRNPEPHYEESATSYKEPEPYYEEPAPHYEEPTSHYEEHAPHYNEEPHYSQHASKETGTVGSHYS